MSLNHLTAELTTVEVVRHVVHCGIQLTEYEPCFHVTDVQSGRLHLLRVPQELLV